MQLKLKQVYNFISNFNQRQRIKPLSLIFYINKLYMKQLYNYHILILATILSVLSFIGCSGPNDSINDPLSDGFDRKGLLENITNNIIIPAHVNLSEKLVAMQSSANDFSNNTNEQSLIQLRKDWLAAYRAWQYVEMFNIAKAEEIFYVSKMNIYPTNISRIEANILSNDYDLDNQANNFPAQGFPAIDYMLYGLDGDSTMVLNKYISNNGPDYKLYLNNLIQQMVNNTNLVIDFWQNNSASFISSTENTASSSFNMLINDYIYYYEKGLRANKIGIPAGRFSSTPLPDRVEAYYRKDVSKLLALDALDASKRFFIGQGFNNNQNGESLKTYIEYLPGEDFLEYIIIENFENAESHINGLSNSFINQIETDNLQMLYTYDAIQENVVKLKTDMLSRLNIAVDYIDADGD